MGRVGNINDINMNLEVSWNTNHHQYTVNRTRALRRVHLLQMELAINANIAVVVLSMEIKMGAGTMIRVVLARTS
jgi:hypothetical protein